MADTSPTDQTTPGSAPAEDGRAPNARARLKALKERRMEMQAAPATPPSPPAGGGRANAGAGLRGGGNERRGKMLMRIYGILTENVGAETKMIPGTPFSEQGVAKLMETLRGRAAADGKPGAKMAGLALSFLAPKDGEEAVAGASLAKLNTVAAAAKRQLRGA